MTVVMVEAQTTHGPILKALATLVAGKEAGNEMLQPEDRESMK